MWSLSIMFHKFQILTSCSQFRWAVRPRETDFLSAGGDIYFSAYRTVYVQRTRRSAIRSGLSGQDCPSRGCARQGVRQRVSIISVRRRSFSYLGCLEGSQRQQII